MPCEKKGGICRAGTPEAAARMRRDVRILLLGEGKSRLPLGEGGGGGRERAALEIGLPPPGREMPGDLRLRRAGVGAQCSRVQVPNQPFSPGELIAVAIAGDLQPPRGGWQP